MFSATEKPFHFGRVHYRYGISDKLLQKGLYNSYNFKNYALKAGPASTQMAMRSTVPVRLLNNKFAEEIKIIEQTYKGEELKQKVEEHLGKFRAMNGMHNGDLDQGELEIGQIVGLIKDIPSVEEVMKELVDDYQKTLSQLPLKL